MYIETHPDMLLEMIKAEQRALWKEAEMQALIRRARAVRPRPSPRGLRTRLQAGPEHHSGPCLSAPPARAHRRKRSKTVAGSRL
jgi:hypothetical protein